MATGERLRGWTTHILPASLAAIVVMAVVTVQAPADAEEPSWAQRRPSVRADPQSILAKAPHGRAVRIAVAERTEHGPRFHVLTPKDRSEAIEAIADAQHDPDTLAISVPRPVRITTDDPYYSQQWALPALKVPSVLALGGDGAGSIVAVVDTGVVTSSPELSGRLVAGQRFIDGAPSSNTADDNGHGSHVAGIVAAAANNGVGIAGVAPRASIMPVKVLDADGLGTSLDVALGIVWAADHGADVINMSFAADTPDDLEKSAVDYAVGKGVTMVAAAGNEYCPSVSQYPAKYTGVIGVGAVSQSLSRVSFSSCGSWVDLAAPGYQIISLTQTGGFIQRSGTSMAAPHVAAAAAVLRALIGPKATAAGVESLLRSTAQDRGSVGRDDSYGSGLLAPYAAARRALTSAYVVIPTSVVTAGSTVTFAGYVKHRDTSPVVGAKVAVAVTSGGSTRTSTVTTSSTGRYAASFRLTEAASVTISYAGSGSSQPATQTKAYARVRPTMTVTRHATWAALTVGYYGQKVTLEKKSGGVWKTVRTMPASSAGSWRPSTGRGTWRFHSYGSSRIFYRYSSAWTS